LHQDVMARKLTTRKPYRPPPKGGTPVAVRMPPALAAKIDAWAEQHEVGRSEAVRRLAEKALSCTAESGAT
jgi:hypothetical protein